MVKVHNQTEVPALLNIAMPSNTNTVNLVEQQVLPYMITSEDMNPVNSLQLTHQQL
jgi:hypothetical protein